MAGTPKRRRYIAAPSVRANETRDGDTFVRDYIDHCGTIAEAERKAGLGEGNLRLWLHDPDRRLSADNARKLARAADLPFEAVMFRFDPINSLDCWAWLKAHRKVA